MYVHLGYTWVHVFACMPVYMQVCVCVCVHVRGGLEDYKEEVNGKYTLGDKIRGRHSFAAPPLLLPHSLLSVRGGRALGKSNRWFRPGRKAGWAWGGQAYRLLGAIKSS